MTGERMRTIFTPFAGEESHSNHGIRVRRTPVFEPGTFVYPATTVQLLFEEAIDYIIVARTG